MFLQIENNIIRKTNLELQDWGPRIQIGPQCPPLGYLINMESFTNLSIYHSSYSVGLIC